MPVGSRGWKHNGRKEKIYFTLKTGDWLLKLINEHQIIIFFVLGCKQIHQLEFTASKQYKSFKRYNAWFHLLLYRHSVQSFKHTFSDFSRTRWTPCRSQIPFARETGAWRPHNVDIIKEKSFIYLQQLPITQSCITEDKPNRFITMHSKGMQVFFSRQLYWVSIKKVLIF